MTAQFPVSVPTAKYATSHLISQSVSQSVWQSMRQAAYGTFVEHALELQSYA